MTTDLATLRRQLKQLEDLHAGGALAGDAYAVHGSFNRGETATSAAYPQLAADVSAVLDAP